MDQPEYNNIEENKQTYSKNEVIELSLRFFNSLDQIDFESLSQDIQSLSTKIDMFEERERELLNKLRQEVQERLMILDAVSNWAQETQDLYVLIGLEPKEWRVSVKTDSGEIVVYATKTWDIVEEDVVILINPGGKLTKPLRY